MPVVRVDEEVWDWLKSHATPLEDTPNTVLRRLAGLDTPSHAPALPSHGLRARARSVSNRGPDGETERLSRNKRDYVVTKSADNHKHWWFQIYQRKLTQRARRGDFLVVVVCDLGAPSQIVFHVPYAYLRDKILPKAKLEPDKRYMFEVRKDSHEFVFHPSIRFDGRPFLVEL